MPPPTTANTKTVTHDSTPQLTAAKLTAILAKPIELLTVAELDALQDAIHRHPGGGASGATIGALLA